MSAKTQIEKEIREAVVFLRENNQTIPSETIQFMMEASIEKLKMQDFKIRLEEFKVLKAKCNVKKGYMQGLTPIEYSRINSLYSFLLSSQEGVKYLTETK
jgi:hypothetical protein